jgi:hypothetical protein
MAQVKNVDITPVSGGPSQIINVSQNDVGREIIINVKDGADQFDLTGYTVKLAGRKPSGLGFTVTGTVEDHKAKIVTTKQMTDEYGSIACELKITDENDTVIGTANMILSVEKDPHPESTTDGTAPEVIDTITLILQKAQLAAEDSEAYAIGTRNGVPVGVDDPTFNNNSKFYSEVIGQEAATAGYMYFDIVDGELIYSRTDNVDVDFYLLDGDLYVNLDDE